ncbi:MAG: acyl-CoA reductase [Bacteroidota bacterium]|jgi:hypothetical protein|nr:MAG: acyl-CoA reductase [Bacteroidota bacterium]
MNFEERLRAFVLLGQRLTSIDSITLNSLYDRAGNQNPWFTSANVTTALTGVSRILRESDLRQWLSSYAIDRERAPKTIGLVLAGNIPLVGFHDILAVLITGNIALIKLSSKDSVLIEFVLQQLTDIEPRFGDRFSFTEQLKNFDAVIATGSDNTSRYFEYYFGKYPSIIRKNRTSCAILTGKETDQELDKLASDVFTYFGLGCRNVSKLWVPENYDFPALLDQWKKYEEIIQHHKYANNYDYQKAIALVNKTPFLDNGIVLLMETDKIVSPVSVLYYQYYQNENDLNEKLALVSDKIQCIVGSAPPATVPFGQAQFPGPGDYADNVDTVKFLLGLS